MKFKSWGRGRGQGGGIFGFPRIGYSWDFEHKIFSLKLGPASQIVSYTLCIHVETNDVLNRLWLQTENKNCDCVLLYFRMSWNIEAFSLCVFISTKSPSGPPWNEGHRPKARHETSVLEVPAQEQR